MNPHVLFALIAAVIISNAAAYRYHSPTNHYQAKNGHGNYKPAVYPKQYTELIKIFEAKNLEFGFPSDYERAKALKSGRYNPDNPIPIDVDVFYPDKSNGNVAQVFLTVPRFGQGVPYSLAYLSNVQRPNGTELQPYPSYDWHSSHGANCDGLTSIYRIQIDSCGQLWILDSGEIEFVQHCPPQIFVFDLYTNKLVHRYRLRNNDYKPKISRFVSILVDVADPVPFGRCKNAFVYMADPTGMGIVVYDKLNGRSWRIENKYTYPDPNFGTHTIAGESFELLDGTLGLAITPRDIGLQRLLYFHSLSNDLEVAIPLDIINNSTNWTPMVISSSLDDFIPLGKRGVQCAASVITPSGIWLCGFMEPIGLFSWNIRKPYTAPNIEFIIENPKTLQFASGLKVIRHPSGRDDLWVVSNRLQKAFSGTLNFNEINYRIQRCPINDVIAGNACEGRP